jgi:hypothetical protein
MKNSQVLRKDGQSQPLLEDVDIGKASNCHSVSEYASFK